MIIMEKTVYNDGKSMFSIEELYFIGGYITYEMAVSTCGFSGKCTFCISEYDIKDIIKSLDIMLETLSGETIINDSESNAFFRVYFQKNNSFYVSGQLGGDHCNNVLKFKFKADQTFLYNMKNTLLNY